ncbi:NUDIX domain-containing protein [Nitrosococcus wardiae]|uniref:NUDIX domain-containing protein n=1 Tax=Nitrosococcus wardiae TaxID=1814290 RepID=A0A4V1AW76_9GAMM|nr:bis(5'-nucleosyl)-tetraphosphatase [Nitrosococcus wardiae]QBQ55665.1 NUDIX domain-containing protein [Nitrosococcus wardiae]
MKIKQHSAGVVVIRKTDEGCRYLLLRAYHYWDFPKGLVRPGEEPLVAACREVEEETGLTQLEFWWGYEHYETVPYGRGKVARYYLALAPKGKVSLPVSLELGRPEHHEFRWVSYQEGFRLLGERLRQVLAWARQISGCDAGEARETARIMRIAVSEEEDPCFYGVAVLN